jgi:hypothetical protein
MLTREQTRGLALRLAAHQEGLDETLSTLNEHHAGSSAVDEMAKAVKHLEMATRILRTEVQLSEQMSQSAAKPKEARL